MKHIVDAHPLLWFFAGSPRLGAAAKAVMTDPASELVIPATAYAEACWIAEHGKVPPVTGTKIRAAIDADPRCVIHPLDREVVDRSQSLTMIGKMHDRQIVSTALVLADQGEQVMLITRDENITASGVISILW